MGKEKKDMEIKVLGPGCQRCKALYAETEKALKLSGVEASVTKVEDMKAIMGYRIMITPALVIDGEVKCAGRIPTIAEISSWIMTAAARAEGV
jgi:small redox-active disulfide protein 2